MEQFKDIEFILWTKLKDGNIEALGELYNIFIDDLFFYGMQFSNDKSCVMDGIHDVFLNLYKYRKTIANTDNVKYYLLRSLKNQILKQPKDKVSYLNESTDHSGFSSSIEAQIIVNEFSNERACKLSNAIKLLSKGQRYGLFLRFTEGHTYEEMADIMNISVQTARTIVYRAVKVLRKNLAILIISILHLFY
ncbi:MAG: sigma-70 family RNA polymerase sigma factor [Gillisia sp.]|nr:sigma-70 family RNA polymerase sigma factor [Gillisia sp.]